MPSIQPALPNVGRGVTPPNTLNLPEDLLARHPEWASIVNNQQNGMTVPSGYSTSAGNLPLTPSQGGPPLPAQSPSITGGDPRQAEWEAQQNLLNAQQQNLGLQQTANGFMRDEVQAAKTGVLNAQETDVKANRGYLDEQIRFNDLQMANQRKILDAKNDTTDIKNTARAQRERDTSKYRYELAGLPTPLEIVLPEGYEGSLPLGIVEKIRSLAEIVADKAQDQEALAKFAVEAARIHAANTGLAVTEAQIRSGRVALSLDEVEQALRASGFQVDQAQLALTASRLPPSPYLVFDEISGQWVEPSIARMNQALESRRISEAVNEQYGDPKATGLGAAPIDTLMTWASSNPPTITEAELRQGLREREVPEMLIEKYVIDAARRRATSTSGLDPDIQSLLDEIKKGRSGVTSTATPGIGNVTPPISANDPRRAFTGR